MKRRPDLLRYVGLSMAYGVNRSILAIVVLVPGLLGASAEGLGRLEILIAATTVAASLGPLGTGDALMHQKFRASPADWWFALALSAVLGAFIGGVVTYLVLASMMGLGIALGAMRSLQTMGQSRLRVDDKLWPLLASAAATLLAAATVFAIAYRAGVDLSLAAALALTAGLAGSAVVAAARYGKRVHGSRPQAGKMLKFGIPLSFGIMFIALLAEFDRFMIQAFISLEAVGVYGVSYRWVSFLSGLSATVVSWWTAEAFRRGGLWASPRWKRLAARTTLGVAVLAALLAWPFAWVVGQTFERPPDDFLLLVIWLEVAVVGFVPAGFAVAVLAVNGSTSRVALIWAVSAAANIAANLIAIPRFGIAGAGFTTAAAYILAAVLAWRWADGVRPVEEGSEFRPALAGGGS